MLLKDFFGPQSFRCANTQPFLCNELGPFQAILGNFQAISGNLLGPFSGIFRQFQAILGNFRQFLAILGGQSPRKKPVLINKNKAEDCTPNKVSSPGNFLKYVMSLRGGVLKQDLPFQDIFQYSYSGMHGSGFGS